MKIFTTHQIKDIDRLTMRYEPISSEELMERAATALYSWLAARVASNTRIVVLCGSGNNGGDGLALARLMHLNGFWVEVYHLVAEHYSPEFTLNLERLQQHHLHVNALHDTAPLPPLPPDSLVVDALFGAGLSRPLQGQLATLVEHINASGAKVVSIDMPSGMMGEAHHTKHPTVRADVCLTLGQPKLSLLLPEAEVHAPRWEVIDIGLHPQALAEVSTPYQMPSAADIGAMMLPLSPFAHKGTQGHVLVVGGSPGTMGAVLLCAQGASRSGAGLVTAHVPMAALSLLLQRQPEVLSSCGESIALRHYTAAAIGPGLGTSDEAARLLIELLERRSLPLLLDADALNIIGQRPELWDKVPNGTIITPHPKEFDRLFGPTASGYDRLQRARQAAQQHGVMVVLKGAYTQVCLPNGEVHINPTGNAGMACGGSGDVLAGLIAGLLAQGYSPERAAIVGVFAHGLSGDLAAQKIGQLGMNSADIANFVAEALKLLAAGPTDNIGQRQCTLL